MTSTEKIRTVQVATETGEARVHWYPARRPRLLLAARHGAGGGIQARDLRAPAARLPRHGEGGARAPRPRRAGGPDP